MLDIYTNKYVYATANYLSLSLSLSLMIVAEERLFDSLLANSFAYSLCTEVCCSCHPRHDSF